MHEIGLCENVKLLLFWTNWMLDYKLIKPELCLVER